MARSDKETAQMLGALSADIKAYSNLAVVLKPKYNPTFNDLEVKLEGYLTGDRIDWEVCVEIYDYESVRALILTDDGFRSFSVDGTEIDAIVDELIKSWERCKKNCDRRVADREKQKKEAEVKAATDKAELNRHRQSILAKLTEEERKTLGF